MNPNETVQNFISVVAKAHAFDAAQMQAAAATIAAKDKQIAALKAELDALKAAPKVEP